jgi:hypothetical protein
MLCESWRAEDTIRQWARFKPKPGDDAGSAWPNRALRLADSKEK